MKPLPNSFATHTPLVTLKSAMTLDGKIAPPPGELHIRTALGGGGATGGWITSVPARAHVQELRHQHDAIMVGVGTIVADDPLLTDRTGLPRRRPLLRVIMDSRLRLPQNRAWSRRPRMMFSCSVRSPRRRGSNELQNHGIRVEQIPAPHRGRPPGHGRDRPPPGRMEITSLLIEGGAMINWTALASGLVDKVFLYYAPKILAGTGSVPFAAGDGFARMSEAAYVKAIRLHRFGEDFAVEGYLRDPYETE